MYQSFCKRIPDFISKITAGIQFPFFLILMKTNGIPSLKQSDLSGIWQNVKLGLIQ